MNVGGLLLLTPPGARRRLPERGGFLHFSRSFPVPAICYTVSTGRRTGKDGGRMRNDGESQQRWSEGNSADFIETADLFVPARAEQIAALLALIPARPDEAFTVAELASGDGTLAQAVLDAFPACHYLALDGSEVMRAQVRIR